MKLINIIIFLGMNNKTINQGGFVLLIYYYALLMMIGLILLT